MATAHTRLTGFLNYLTATPTRRAAAIRQATGTDYDPLHDYYMRMRRAVAADRRTTRDGQAVTAAATNATPTKRTRFEALAANWQPLTRRWRSSAPATVHRTDVVIGGLTLTISPSFAELHPDGSLEIVLVRFAATPLTRLQMDLVLRVMQRAFTPIHPDCDLTFIDLATKTLRTSRGRATALEALDTWVDTEAAGLAFALRAA